MGGLRQETDKGKRNFLYTGSLLRSFNVQIFDTRFDLKDFLLLVFLACFLLKEEGGEVQSLKITRSFLSFFPLSLCKFPRFQSFPVDFDNIHGARRK